MACPRVSCSQSTRLLLVASSSVDAHKNRHNVQYIYQCEVIIAALQYIHAVSCCSTSAHQTWVWLILAPTLVTGSKRKCIQPKLFLCTRNSYFASGHIQAFIDNEVHDAKRPQTHGATQCLDYTTQLNHLFTETDHCYKESTPPYVLLATTVLCTSHHDQQ